MTTTIEAKKLTTEERNAIPNRYFAVPETEQLPCEDAVHTKMAWRMLPKTMGLSDTQRKRAKNFILRRAHELGINTKEWNIKAEEMEAALQADIGSGEFVGDAAPQMPTEEEEKEGKEIKASFQGMAVIVPETPDHPNKVPFSGVLTRIDEPSDNPLGGSDGKCVIITRAVAEKALSSLLLMSIDYQDDLSGHDPTQKIGIIESANIVSNEITISGFFYGADYPHEVKRIQAEKSQLGFSYEAQVKIQSMNDDPLIISECIFTGAAVLYKDKAAYTSTSLTANADEDIKMSKELMEAITALTAQVSTLQEQVKEVKASASTSVQANAVCAMVEPHAKALEGAADAMEKSGIGLHARSGHVAMIRGVANHMRAEAAMGKLPHVYQTSDFYTAAADKSEGSKEKESDLKILLDKISSLETKLADAEKQRFHASSAPDRRTLTPEIKALMANNGIGEKDSGKLAVDTVDRAFKEKGMSISDRITQKLLMSSNGMIEGGN